MQLTIISTFGTKPASEAEKALADDLLDVLKKHGADWWHFKFEYPEPLWSIPHTWRTIEKADDDE